MPQENRDVLLAEYEKIGIQEGITINLRFVTLGTFAVVNGFLLTAYGYILTSPDTFSIGLLIILAIALFGINLVFFFLERRTSDGMDQLRNHGVAVGNTLGMSNNIYRKTLDAREGVATHEKILTGLYRAMAAIGLIGGLAVAALWQAPPEEKDEIAELMRTIAPAAVELQVWKGR